LSVLFTPSSLTLKSRAWKTVQIHLKVSTTSTVDHQQRQQQQLQLWQRLLLHSQSLVLVPCN
ncbi:hypothetical protein TYRP_006844, partial [Tyrophagus putrescentiae]